MKNIKKPCLFLFIIFYLFILSACGEIKEYDLKYRDKDMIMKLIESAQKETECQHQRTRLEYFSQEEHISLCYLCGNTSESSPHELLSYDAFEYVDGKIYHKKAYRCNICFVDNIKVEYKICKNQSMDCDGNEYTGEYKYYAEN